MEWARTCGSETPRPEQYRRPETLETRKKFEPGNGSATGSVPETGTVNEIETETGNECESESESEFEFVAVAVPGTANENANETGFVGLKRSATARFGGRHGGLVRPEFLHHHLGTFWMP